MHDNLLSPVEFEPADRGDFEARLSFDSFGCVDIVRTCSAPASIEYTNVKVARMKAHRVYVLTPTVGSVRVSTWGRDITLNVGDFTVFDNSAPFRMSFEETNHALVLQTAPDVMERYMPDAERWFGLPMPVARGLNITASAMLQSLWAAVERGVPNEIRPGIAKSLLEIVAAAYAMEFGCDIDESSMRRARRAQVKRLIESRLQESGLCPRSIAEALRLSPRYLRQLFGGEGETIQHYILRRRLEECAERLADKRWSNRSVTDIAFGWGFVSPAHFARAFKGWFATTPTAYRRTGQFVASGKAKLRLDQASPPPFGLTRTRTKRSDSG